MRSHNGRLQLAATDLARHLACRHLTQLDRAAAEGRIEAPVRTDPVLDALRERGTQHERAFEEHLRSLGLEVVRLEPGAGPDGVVDAMRRGVDVIVQASLSDRHFRGTADFLQKVPRPSDLGDYSYEVSDTKLAQQTRAGTILQLSLYSELVANVQGTWPEYMHVTKPGEPFEQESFRCGDFDAYYRLVKRRLGDVVEGSPDDSTYPTPVPECDVCRWWQHCMERRRADDHLCLVAGMSALHTEEFHRQGVTTLAQLGQAADALPERPERGSVQAFERLHQQARIQLRGREAGQLFYDLLPLEDERGLRRLPEPSPGDVFFDIEAARFFEDGGFEYLFGWCVREESGALPYRGIWARNRTEERRALEEFMAVVMQRWKQHADMHVYHFTPYEPSALKRLIGRFGTWLLAEMLNYYRREMNSSHWEFFRVHDLDNDDLLDERTAIAGLEFVAVAGGKPRTPLHTYRYPDQETSVGAGDGVYVVGDTLQDLGTVAGIDTATRTVTIKKRQRSIDVHPVAIMVDSRVSPGDKASSLLAFARSVAEHGIDGDGPFRAGRDLLLKRPPRRAHGIGAPLRGDGEELLPAAKRLARELESGVLPTQGPPGSGKTYTGARVILELAENGFRVGVTAVSHKVIRNLLDEVKKTAAGLGKDVRLVHKIPSQQKPVDGDVVEIRKNEVALKALDDGRVVGGVVWLWSREDAVETLDYLVVDEAGQMAIADVLAASRSARNIILLGDPQQLEQPQQAAHPEGTDVAALVHVLEGHKTMPLGKGLFLDKTWRLHPTLCGFTSEVYYESRLTSEAGNERQLLARPPPFTAAGLFLVPVEHVGNQSSSREEVEVVRRIVDTLLTNGVTWTDRDGNTGPLTAADILVVTPYNAQIAALKRALDGIEVGTVDKFQGQQGPVVIYSTASSSPEDAPRGLGFLYSPNRFNVATSRAKSAVIVVASPRLFEPECRTPEQMRWANGLCRYRELAQEVTV